jgi:hypothetical protein
MNPRDSLSCENGSVEEAVALVVDAFQERVRRGEQPDVEEYAQHHPQLADILRRVLPALEALRPGEESLPSPTVPTGENVPAVLGDFRIVREVGKGGMGIVYEAEQVSLHRRVALRCCRLPPRWTRGSCSAFTTRRRRRPVCITPTLCRSTTSAASAAFTSTPCSSSTANHSAT